jgi:hypothetical protein
MNDGYQYDLTFCKIIGTSEFLYVIEEIGGEACDVDVHYYLKYYKDGYILIGNYCHTTHILDVIS